VINQLFTFSKTIERLRQGSLSEYLDTYADAVAAQGYGRHSIREQIVVIADFSRWLKQKQIAVEALDSEVADRFLRLRRRQLRLRGGDAKALQRLLTVLRQKGLVKPHEPVVMDTAQARWLKMVCGSRWRPPRSVRTNCLAPRWGMWQS
jgi:signal transduction protein with GAF and PtsI domain